MPFNPINKHVLAAGILSLIASLTGGCRVAEDLSGAGTRGSSAGSGSGIAAPVSRLTSPEFFKDQIFLTDLPGQKLLTLQAEPLSISDSFPVPFSGSQKIVITFPGRFNVIVSGPDFAIVDSQGQVHKNPTHLNYPVTAASFSPHGGALVLMDEQQNTALVRISSTGKPETSVSLGPPLRNGTIQSGCLLNDNQLILADSHNRIIVSDLKNSMDKKEWVTMREYDYSGQLNSEIQKVFCTRTPEDTLLLVSQKKILIQKTEPGHRPSIHITGKAETDPDSPVVVMHQESTGIIFKKNGAASFALVMPDGSLRKKSIRIDEHLGLVEKAYHIQGSDEVILLSRTQEHSPKFVKKIRLSTDGYTLFSKNIGFLDPERLIFTDQFFIIHHDSPLGSVERFEYVRNAPSVGLQGFNI